MKQLKAALKSRIRRYGTPTASPTTVAPVAGDGAAPISHCCQLRPPRYATGSRYARQPEKPQPAEPFAYADWTWLNGNPRNKDVVWDSKFFTPEIRMDVHYMMDFNHPKDDTMGGSTEIFRSNEIRWSKSVLAATFTGRM